MNRRSRYLSAAVVRCRPDLRDPMGQTPAEVARRRGLDDTAALLEEAAKQGATNPNQCEVTADLVSAMWIPACTALSSFSVD